MGSVHNPMDNRPKDPYEGYKAEGIEDRHSKDQPEEEKTPPSKLAAIAAFILRMLQKIVYIFTQNALKRIPSSSQKKTRENLILFKGCLEILMMEDRSQDIQFLNRMSQLRNAFPPNQPILSELKKYPPNQQHSLDYYLSEYSNQNWIPFPYMDLIRQLHQDHLKDPTHSLLQKWVDEIDLSIKSLD